MALSPTEAARYFFDGATYIWLGAPDFKGSMPGVPLNERFDVSLRSYLPTIARKRDSAAYIGLLSDKVELAYQQFASGESELARGTMLDLLNLIHTHLHLPSKREIDDLVEAGKSMQ